MKTGPGLDVHITKRTALLLLLDIIATYLSYWLASILTNVKGEVFVNNEIYFVLGILAFINVVVLATFRLYNNLWEYASIDEVIQIVGATVLGTLGGAVVLGIRCFLLPSDLLHGRHPLRVPLYASKGKGYRLVAAHMRPPAHAGGRCGRNGLVGNRAHGVERPAHAWYPHRCH